MPGKVLLVAYHWPPANSAGAHRPLRFARHLRQFGWEPAVLAAEPIRYERYDPDLLRQAPEEIEVVRAPHRDAWLAFKAWRAERRAGAGQAEPRAAPAGRRAWQGRVVEWAQPRLYHPDLAQGWIGPAARAARRRWPRGEFQAIWATGGPWSALEIGYRLARQWQAPLVLDLRDGWTLADDDHSARRPAWAKRWDRERLARYFVFAQAVTLLHGGYAEAYLAAYPELKASKIHLIPNGFEPAEANPQPMPPPGDCLQMVYAGSLHGRRYDTLLEALARLRRRQALRLKLTLLGEAWQGLHAAAERLGVADLLACLGPQPARVVRDHVAAAHVLLLLGETQRPGYELYIASKTFHYLAMRRPILGALPPNETSRVLRRLGAGRVADAASVEQVEAALQEVYLAWQSGALESYLPEGDVLAEFQEPALTEALSRALEGQPPQRPYQSGEAALPPSLQARWNERT
jgi:glycosyltransferase involved in cell wall biosynthesis